MQTCIIRSPAKFAQQTPVIKGLLLPLVSLLSFSVLLVILFDLTSHSSVPFSLIKEGYYISGWCVFSVICCFSNAICNWNRMITGVKYWLFAEKSKLSYGPLQDHARPLAIMLEHIQGAWSSVSRWGKFPECTHSEKMMVSIISQWDLILNMIVPYRTWKKPIGSAKSVPMYAFDKKFIWYLYFQIIFSKVDTGL